MLVWTYVRNVCLCEHAITFFRTQGEQAHGQSSTTSRCAVAAPRPKGRSYTLPSSFLLCQLARVTFQPEGPEALLSVLAKLRFSSPRELLTTHTGGRPTSMRHTPGRSAPQRLCEPGSLAPRRPCLARPFGSFATPGAQLLRWPHKQYPDPGCQVEQHC